MWLRCLEISMPNSFSARTACSLGGKPSTAPTPAETTRKSLRPFTAWRKSPSAIGLRQILPVQTKRIVFIHPISRLNLVACGRFVNAKSTGSELLHHGESLQQIERARQDRITHDSPRLLQLPCRGPNFVVRVQSL